MCVYVFVWVGVFVSRGSSVVCSALLGLPGGLKGTLEVLKPSPVFLLLPRAEGTLDLLAD